MNTASTLIAILPEASLAVVTGGNDWVVSGPCWWTAAAIATVAPGAGVVAALFALSCLIPIF